MNPPRSQSQMTGVRQPLLPVRVFAVSMMAFPIVLLMLSASVVFAATESNEGHHELLSGDRILFATVEEISSADVRVNTGELQPRYLPLNVRKEKGLPDLKPGNRVAITVNDQNLIVDIHLLGETDHHQIIRGVLAQPLMTEMNSDVV